MTECGRCGEKERLNGQKFSHLFVHGVQTKIQRPPVEMSATVSSTLFRTGTFGFSNSRLTGGRRVIVSDKAGGTSPSAEHEMGGNKYSQHELYRHV